MVKISKKIFFIVLSGSFVFSFSCQNNKRSTDDNKIILQNKSDSMSTINKTEEEWKKILNPEQYFILRQKGTERPWTGKYNNHFEKGVYVCAACGFELFTSESKFDSHCGWPSFDNEIKEGNVSTQSDYSHGMVRTEINCARCGGHLGHVFEDGPTKTGLRYCVNSVSIEFKDENMNKETK